MNNTGRIFQLQINEQAINFLKEIALPLTISAMEDEAKNILASDSSPDEQRKNLIKANAIQDYSKQMISYFNGFLAANPKSTTEE